MENSTPLDSNLKGDQPSLMQHTLKWGLISGAVSILLMVILYVVDYTLMVDWKLAIFVLVLGLGIVIYAGIDYRNSVGGYLAYGKAWQHGFLVFLFSALIYTVFNLLLHNVIDTELAGKLTDAGVEKQREMFEGFGMQEEQIEQALVESRKSLERQFTVVGSLTGLGFGAIIYAVLAAISAIFVRRNEPVENM